MPTTCFLGKAWRLNFRTALLPCPWHPAPLRTFGSKRRICSTQGSLLFTKLASPLWILLTQRACHSERWFPGAQGSYSSFDSVMAKSLVTCWLKGFCWVVLDLLSIHDEDIRDQQCSGPDCASWHVNSPRWILWLHSGGNGILLKCTSAF